MTYTPDQFLSLARMYGREVLEQYHPDVAAMFAEFAAHNAFCAHPELREGA